jgi:hypothetical protein
MTISSSSRRKTHRKCCVRNCTNPAAQGRKTCGKHPSKAASRTVKTSCLHFDRVLQAFDRDKFDFRAGAIASAPLPTERAYIADVVIRSDGSILGLPTTRTGLARFLAEWLTLPGHTFYTIQQITAPTIPVWGVDTAICAISAVLVRYDLDRGGAA